MIAGGRFPMGDVLPYIVAQVVGGWALSQLWLFWVAPILGGMVGGVMYRWLSEEPSAQITGSRPSS